MARRLPSLSALRAFEAAARHASFTLAADELAVTQGAVSRQVRALEEELGVALFRRGHRKVELTAEGARLLQPLTDALDRVAAAAGAIREGRRALRVKALPTFSMRLLIPGLARLRAAHPELEVQLITAWQEADLDRDDVDAAILYRRAGGRGAEDDDVVLPELVAAVCSPRLLAGGPPLAAPADLRRHRLLLNVPSGRDWRAWAEVTGAGDLPLGRGLVFDLDEPAIAAAVEGHGVALATLAFVRRELRSGQLVTPLAIPPVRLGHYHLARRPDAAGDPRLDRFREWLRAEVAGTASPPPPPPAPPPATPPGTA